MLSGVNASHGNSKCLRSYLLEAETEMGILVKVVN